MLIRKSGGGGSKRLSFPQIRRLRGDKNSISIIAIGSTELLWQHHLNSVLLFQEVHAETYEELPPKGLAKTFSIIFEKFAPF